MLTPPFVLHRPKSVEEACAIAAHLASEGRPFDWVAGGTDLLPNYKWHLNPKGDVISLAHVDGADALASDRIGCMARLHDVATSEVVHPLLAAAAAKLHRASSAAVRPSVGTCALTLDASGTISLKTGVAPSSGATKQTVGRAQTVGSFPIKTRFVWPPIKATWPLRSWPSGPRWSWSGQTVSDAWLSRTSSNLTA